MFLLLLAGCTPSNTDPFAFYSQVRLYSMGPSEYLATCYSKFQYCVDLAAKTCPQGYDEISSSTMIVDRTMNIKFKCR